MQQTRPAKGAFLVWREANVKAGAVESANKTAAHGRQHELHAGHEFQFLFDLERHFVDRAEARAFGRRDTNVKLAFIHVAGEIFLSYEFVKRDGGRHDQQGHAGHQPAVPYSPGQDASVGPVDTRVETAAGRRDHWTTGRRDDRTTWQRVRGLWSGGPAVPDPQQPRTHHRCKRERYQQAHQHGNGRGKPELIKKPSRDARHERDRHEDYHEAQRRRHHGQADLRGRGLGRFEGTHLLFFDEAENILEYDDG